ncbi:MAG: hypothetical protein ACH350_01165 [Parachlamydiaceae bacterium]
MKLIKQIQFFIYFLVLSFASLEAEDWSLPKTIGSTVSSASDIAVDDAGDAICVFLHSEGINQRVRSAFRPSKQEWIIFDDALSSTDLNATSPHVAMSKIGNATAVWEATGFAHPFIQTATFDIKKNRWSTPFNLTGPIELGADPIVGIDHEGNSLVIWSIFDGVSFRIQSAILSHAESNWTYLAEMIVERAYNLDLAIDPAGNAVLVWEGSAGFKTIIQAAVLHYGTYRWVQTHDVTPSNVSSTLPKIGVNQAGDAIAVWSEQFFIFTSISSAKLLFGTTTWGPINKLTSQMNSHFPDIAVDPKGNAVAVWVDFPNENQASMQAATLKAGSSIWSNPTTLATSSTMISPEVVTDKQGNAVAVWVAAEGVQTSLLPIGQNWSAPETITAPEGGAITSQGIAMSPCSFAVITYTAQILSIQLIEAVHSKKIFPPMLDLDLRGKMMKWDCHPFLRCKNRLKWNPDSSGCVTHYLLKKNGKVIAKIPEHGPYKYDDRVLCQSRKNAYTVTAVKSNGATYTSSTVVLP